MTPNFLQAILDLISSTMRRPSTKHSVQLIAFTQQLTELLTRTAREQGDPELTQILDEALGDASND